MQRPGALPSCLLHNKIEYSYHTYLNNAPPDSPEPLPISFFFCWSNFRYDYNNVRFRQGWHLPTRTRTHSHTHNTHTRWHGLFVFYIALPDRVVKVATAVSYRRRVVVVDTMGLMMRTERQMRWCSFVLAPTAVCYEIRRRCQEDHFHAGSPV